MGREWRIFQLLSVESNPGSALSRALALLHVSKSRAMHDKYQSAVMQYPVHICDLENMINCRSISVVSCA